VIKNDPNHPSVFVKIPYFYLNSMSKSVWNTNLWVVKSPISVKPRRYEVKTRCPLPYGFQEVKTVVMEETSHGIMMFQATVGKNIPIHLIQKMMLYAGFSIDPVTFPKRRVTREFTQFDELYHKRFKHFNLKHVRLTPEMMINGKNSRIGTKKGKGMRVLQDDSDQFYERCECAASNHLGYCQAAKCDRFSWFSRCLCLLCEGCTLQNWDRDDYNDSCSDWTDWC
jgi:hypothetical protein